MFSKEMQDDAKARLVDASSANSGSEHLLFDEEVILHNLFIILLFLSSSSSDEEETTARLKEAAISLEDIFGS